MYWLVLSIRSEGVVDSVSEVVPASGGRIPGGC